MIDACATEMQKRHCWFRVPGKDVHARHISLACTELEREGAALFALAALRCARLRAWPTRRIGSAK